MCITWLHTSSSYTAFCKREKLPVSEYAHANSKGQQTDSKECSGHALMFLLVGYSTHTPSIYSTGKAVASLTGWSHFHSQFALSIILASRTAGKAWEHALYVVGYEEKDHSRKMQFLLFFNLSPFQGHKSPRLPTWSVDSLGLLLHRSNVRS